MTADHRGCSYQHKCAICDKASLCFLPKTMTSRGTQCTEHRSQRNWCEMQDGKESETKARCNAHKPEVSHHNRKGVMNQFWCDVFVFAEFRYLNGRNNSHFYESSCLFWSANIASCNIKSWLERQPRASKANKWLTFAGIYKPSFSYRELHTEKMKWRNKGSSENSAVIWSFKGGKAGEDIVVTNKVRGAKRDADSLIFRYEKLSPSCGCFQYVWFGLFCLKFQPALVLRAALRWLAKARVGTASTKRVNPAGFRWASFQLGALWRLPSPQSLIMSLHEPRFTRHIYWKDDGKFYFILSEVARKSHHDNFFPLFTGKNSESEREEKTRRETRHTLNREGFQPLLFHLSGFISALILDFRTPSHILKSRRFHSLSGQDYSNKIVSSNSSNITTCSPKRVKKK